MLEFHAPCFHNFFSHWHMQSKFTIYKICSVQLQYKETTTILLTFQPFATNVVGTACNLKNMHFCDQDLKLWINDTLFLIATCCPSLPHKFKVDCYVSPCSYIWYVHCSIDLLRGALREIDATSTPVTKTNLHETVSVAKCSFVHKWLPKQTSRKANIYHHTLLQFSTLLLRATTSVTSQL